MSEGTQAVRSSSLLRGDTSRVSFLELFFDLVFVFAITQIAHFLIEHHGAAALAEAAAIFAAVWWAWMYTTWASNWADPERVPVRTMLLLVMLASLLMAVAIPRAFEDLGGLFAAAYVAIQVGRSAFLAVVMRRDGHVSARSMLRITLLFAISGALWLYGGFAAQGLERLGWWGAALALEYAGPFTGFRLPFLGKVSPSEWTISGCHMAERCALFIIIALGEGIVVTGATFAGQEMTRPHVLAFLIAFFSSVLMWWIYFDLGAKRGAEHIEQHAEPGRIARNAYTYLHIPIVVGIIGAAVADEMLLAHPGGAAPVGLVWALCGGCALFLFGIGCFKLYSSPLGNFPLSHWVGLGLFVVIWDWGLSHRVDAMLLGASAVAILAMVAIWEWVSFHGGWAGRFGRGKANEGEG